MSEVTKSIALSAPAADVWGLVGGFDSVPAWHPAAATCTLRDSDGDTQRVIGLKAGGPPIVERLIALDDTAMTCTYAIVESPLPVAGYQATFAIRDWGAGCEVVWTGRFEPAGVPEDQAMAIVAGIYDAGLDALKARFG